VAVAGARLPGERLAFPGVAGHWISQGRALALAALSLTLAGCGGSSPSSTAGGAKSARSAPPAVGKPIRIRPDGTTLVVNVRRVIFPLRGSGVLLSPGDRAAGVEVAVRNAGRAVYDSSSESDVALETSTGTPATPGFASSGPCRTSEIDFLKEVQPGESRSGCVAFDVPKGSKPAKVRFAPEGESGLAQAWVVRR
jgi:hypothetical protein